MSYSLKNAVLLDCLEAGAGKRKKITLLGVFFCFSVSLRVHFLVPQGINQAFLWRAFCPGRFHFQFQAILSPGQEIPDRKENGKVPTASVGLQSLISFLICLLWFHFRVVMLSVVSCLHSVGKTG